MNFLVAMAVTVSAMTCTVSGIILRTTRMWENSFLKVVPLKAKTVKVNTKLISLYCYNITIT